MFSRKVAEPIGKMRERRAHNVKENDDTNELVSLQFLRIKKTSNIFSIDKSIVGRSFGVNRLVIRLDMPSFARGRRIVALVVMPSPFNELMRTSPGAEKPEEKLVKR